MTNPQSKATEQTTAEDVPPGICSAIQFAIHVKHNPLLIMRFVSTECVAGPMEGTSVDDYKPDIYPSSPGIRLCEYIQLNFMLFM